MGADGLHWNGSTWLMKIDGRALTEEQDHWFRKGCEAEAEARMSVRKQSPEKVAQFMETLEAIEEHWEPKTIGELLSTITRIYVSELAHEDKRDIRLALRGHKKTWFHRLVERLA